MSVEAVNHNAAAATGETPPLGTVRCAWSAATKAGNPQNEDRYVAAAVDLPGLDGMQAYLFAIADGHGGAACSEFVRENLVPEFAAAFAQAFGESAGRRTRDSLLCGTLRACFAALDAKYVARSGSVRTAGACVLCCAIYDGTLYLANCGDCRALLGYREPAGTDRLQPQSLTEDQNCFNDTEVARVKRRCTDPNPIRAHPRDAANFPRVAGVLAVTRALGDEFLKTPVPRLRTAYGLFAPYITARPVCTVHRLRPARDVFAVLASDGLTSLKSNAEIVEDVRDILDACVAVPGTAGMVAETLVRLTIEDKVPPLPPTTPLNTTEGVVGDDAPVSSPPLRAKRHDDITVVILTFEFVAGDDTVTDVEPTPATVIDVDAIDDTDGEEEVVDPFGIRR
jgi:serine/threonine protein phosphatase PrpC